MPIKTMLVGSQKGRLSRSVAAVATRATATSRPSAAGLLVARSFSTKPAEANLTGYVSSSLKIEDGFFPCKSSSKHWDDE